MAPANAIPIFHGGYGEKKGPFAHTSRGNKPGQPGPASGLLSVSSLLALALAGRVRISEPELSREELTGLKQSSVRDLFEGTALPLSMLILLMSMCYTSVTAFMESYAAEWHLEALSPVFFVVYAAFILVFRPLAGRLLDKKGDNLVMIPAIIFYALSLWVLALAASLPLFLASAVFMPWATATSSTSGRSLPSGPRPLTAWAGPPRPTSCSTTRARGWGRW